MKKIFVTLFILFVLFLGPLSIYLGIDKSVTFYTASRESTQLSPLPSEEKEAVIQFFSAQTFGWRGAFSVHTWLAIKEKNATAYTTYQVIGWRYDRNVSVVKEFIDLPDRKWFGMHPEIILSIVGKDAEKLIPKIKEAINHYPDRHIYRVWPGPNSNTFIAYIGRSTPELHLNMPPNAVGKDYLPNNSFFAPAISGTGYQFSLYGLAGLTLAMEEGIEWNILGLVIGIDFFGPALYLPGFGRVGFSHHSLID